MMNPSRLVTDWPIAQLVRNAWDLPQDAPAAVGAAMLSKSSAGVVYIVESGLSKRLEGVLSIHDLTRLESLKTDACVRDIATMRGIVAVADDARIGPALDLMDGLNSLRRVFRYLPVVRRDTRELVGMISRAEIGEYLKSAVGSRSSVSRSY